MSGVSRIFYQVRKYIQTKLENEFELSCLVKLGTPFELPSNLKVKQNQFHVLIFLHLKYG